MKLYELASQYEFLLNDLYDEETGEIKEQSLARLHEIKDSAENKCINTVKVLKHMQKECAAIEIERKNMAVREKAFKSQIDRLKDYLKENMERLNINKIECPQFIIALQKSPVAVDRYEEKDIPFDYQKITVEYDNTKIKHDILNGVVVPGARLIQNNHVRIK